MLILRVNMQLHSNIIGHGHNRQYAEWLSQLSYNPELQKDISLPGYVHRVSELEDLYEQVFPRTKLHNAYHTLDFWCSRAILTPFNDSVVSINIKLLLRFAGENYKFFSKDSAKYCDNDGHEMSVESLQQLECAGLPLSKLQLKLGAPVMLLQNLDQTSGLNNNSRLILTWIGQYSLERMLLGGNHNGKLQIISRIPLTSVDGDFSFTLTSRQFPVHLCFAITINKLQGQSLNTVGIDLRQPMFCHGQLYIALSCATDVSKMTVLLSEGLEGKTVNIVYPEVLEVVQPMPSQAEAEKHEFGSKEDFLQVLETVEGSMQL